MKTNNKGFAQMAVVLIIVAVLAVGGLVYYKGTNNSNTVPATTETASDNLPAMQTPQNQQVQNSPNPIVCDVNAPASITVLSPNGGETYTTGQQATVKWRSCNVPASQDVAIDLFNANQSLSENCVLTVQNSTGSINQTINDGTEIVTLAVSSCRYMNFQPGNNFKLRVYQLNSPVGTSVQDFSNNNFTIN